VIADSALVRHGTPLFVPDFALDWELDIVPAVVINRLGKTIPPKFATRYYHQIGLMARLLPADGVEGGALSTSFDGALCVGLTLPADNLSQLTVAVGGLAPVTVNRDDLLIDESIALISRYMMLKTGDVILPCSLGLRVKAELGTKVSASLNNSELLSLKIK
jgi:2-keto-4-pentenoate hydratase/2-oxohepta-3-ene-1,7-dioic acid hydratase in catechol pathway